MISICGLPSVVHSTRIGQFEQSV